MNHEKNNSLSFLEVASSISANSEIDLQSLAKQLIAKANGLNSSTHKPDSDICNQDSNTKSKQRYLIAIAGPPASGKSTLAEKLRSYINQESQSTFCEVVPMDGFHFDNEHLDQLGWRHRKGAENTFDSHAFVRLISNLARATEAVSIPLFDRASDAVIPNAKVIETSHRILIIEGNYLLLESEPWSQLRQYYNFTIMLKPNLEKIKNRLIERWKEHGYDANGAKKRALSNDIPNANTVMENSGEADLIIE